MGEAFLLPDDDVPVPVGAFRLPHCRWSKGWSRPSSMNFLLPVVTPVTDVCRLVVLLAVRASVNGEEPFPFTASPVAMAAVRGPDT